MRPDQGSQEAAQPCPADLPEPADYGSRPTLTAMSIAIADRPRSFVRVAGPDSADYLERMLSNEVATLAIGEARDALLLTAKARVIAPLRVYRRGDDDFLLLTEPELGERVRAELVRMRFAAKAEIGLEDHRSTLVFGEERPERAIENNDYGRPAWEVLDEDVHGDVIDERELERLRIEARTPRFGREVDDRVLPAEAGLTERAISFTKGCYPGQEPIARQHYRGKVNRRLRVLDIHGTVDPETELVYEGKTVGRVTSVAEGVALAYVRTEVPDDAVLEFTADAGFARVRSQTTREPRDAPKN
jgi:tRNA-modifying protein YgfZ